MAAREHREIHVVDQTKNIATFITRKSLVESLQVVFLESIYRILDLGVRVKSAKQPI